MNKEIIKVENLTVAFGNFKAVDGVSFEVRRGEIFGFLGANGAGKTTVIRAICGLLNPAAGKIFVDGKDVSENTALLKPRIGYMSQKFTLYKDLSIKENFEFAGALYNMDPRAVARRGKELAKYVKLNYDAGTIVSSLPGGVRQTVSLCAALLHEPELVFLDEPTAGVSPRDRADFWTLIRDIAAKGKTVFVTTHYMDEAAYCGRIALMNAGRISALDSPEALIKRYFPKPFSEITFKNSAALEKAKTELNAGSYARAENYGAALRVEVKSEKEFKEFISKQKNIDKISASPAGLEDVFLKAAGNKT